MDTRDLDISLGEVVTWKGKDARIRHIHICSVSLELSSGEVIDVTTEDLLDENDDIPVREVGETW